MNWRDPPAREHLIKSWTREHCLQRSARCDYCGEMLWYRYYRAVWGTPRGFIVRRYHVECA